MRFSRDYLAYFFKVSITRLIVYLNRLNEDELLILDKR